MVAPQGDSPEARLTALEEQRRNDQQIMERLVAAINEIRVSSTAVKEKVKEHDAALQGQTQMGMTLRQEVFAARAELATGVSAASDAAQAAAMAQMAVQVENKFSELDQLTANLGRGLEALGLRGQRVEQVVEQQVAGQPQHEHVTTGASQQLDAKISHVASMAMKFDGTEIGAGGHQIVPPR